METAVGRESLSETQRHVQCPKRNKSGADDEMQPFKGAGNERL